MRYIRYAFLTVLAVALITVAMANRAAVTLHLLPEEVASFVPLPNTLQLPLFAILFGGIVAGLLIGFIWEWFREHKGRSEGARARREVKALEREVTRLKGDVVGEKDEILALLEKSA
ncbi:phosphoribosylanthranilate isomerase [Marinosulfonomonas sp. PRT-SC04]|nr:phosphoribosylanthranilate isomerase [Marinosulfonomonas sp. PRT-SC04]